MLGGGTKGSQKIRFVELLFMHGMVRPPIFQLRETFMTQVSSKTAPLNSCPYSTFPLFHFRLISSFVFSSHFNHVGPLTPKIETLDKTVTEGRSFWVEFMFRYRQLMGPIVSVTMIRNIFLPNIYRIWKHWKGRGMSSDLQMNRGSSRVEKFRSAI